MARYTKAACLLAMVALLALSAGAVFAQAGEGGTIVLSNTGGDASTFNPIISSDTVSSDIHEQFYPDIFGIDPATLVSSPNLPGDLAAGWEYDETGTVLTMSLRDDLQWSDGTPITADDYLWAFNAVKSGETSSSRTYVFYELDDGTPGGGSIVSAEKIDDYTIEFVLGTVTEDENGEIASIEPNCVAFEDINDIPVVPAHLYEAAFGSDYAAMDEDPYFVPEGTFGPFTDPFFERGVQVSLLADQSYSDAELGYVSPGEWLYVNVEDTTVGYERFRAGDFTYDSVPAQFQNDFRAEFGDSGEFQILEYPSNGYTYMAYNLADPSNPQNGRDENGELIDQGVNPYFSDKNVRQALAWAVDVESMIGTAPDEAAGTPATGIMEGNGALTAVHDHPISWLDTGLEPWGYDPAIADQMLTDAGWTDEDGDGIRECNGCGTAEDGTPFAFTLLTNAGNDIRERAALTIKEQLADVGVEVDFQAIDFGTLVDRLLAQDFDAIIIGWNLGLPYDPDALWAFGTDADAVGAGFNMTSYQNPAMEELFKQANTVLGCANEDRAALFEEALGMLYEDQPYMWLFFSNVMAAAQGYVEGWDPYPYFLGWNIDTWVALED